MKKFYKSFATWGLIIVSIFINLPNVSAQQTITIGQGTSASNYLPTYGYYDYSWSAQLYTAQEFNGTFGNINEIKFNVVSSVSNNQMNNQKIYFYLTSDSVFFDNSYINPTSVGATLVYDGSITWNGTGWQGITLDAPFFYSGTQNLVVLWENYDGSYAGSYPQFYAYSSMNQSKYQYQDGIFPNTNAGIIETVKSNIQFTISNPLQIDLALGDIIYPNPASPINPSANVPVSVRIFNAGTSSQAGYTVKYSIDGGSNFVSEVVNDTVFPFNSYIYTFSQQANMTNIGDYSVVAQVVIANDSNAANDIIYANIKVCVPMSGTYTIGSSGNEDFTTFNSAITAMNSCGISAPVVFEVSSEVFYESLILNPILGASSTNTVTFKGQGKDATTIKATVDYNNYAAIKINGAKHIIFDSIGIVNAAPQNGDFWGILFKSNSDSNIVKNCFIEVGNQNYYSSGIVGSEFDNYISSSQSYTLNYLTIDNCIIYNGSVGINLQGYNIYNTSVGNVITNNTLYDQSQNFILLSAQKDITIKRNKLLRGNNTGNYANGINFANSKGASDISYNVLDLKGGIGISFYNYNVSSDYDTSYVYNNFIAMDADSNSDAKGISLNSSRNINFYYNSILITGDGNSSNSSAFYMASFPQPTSPIEIYNNIFSNEVQGYGLYADVATYNFVSDYNDIYASSETYIYQQYIGGVGSLTQWSNNTGMDTNSVNVNPWFTSTTNLHVNNSAINNIGTPINGITDDIDGNIRSTSIPDIGADEFVPLAHNLGVSLMNGASVDFCNMSTAETLVVQIVNYGTSGETSIPVNYKFDTNAVVSETYTGLLSPGDTMLYSFTQTLDLSHGGHHVILVYTSLANDGENSNDTFYADFNNYESISVFPFYENFEGDNKYFHLEHSSNSDIRITDLNGAFSSKGIFMIGGNYDNWSYSNNLIDIINNNQAHKSSAYTCTLDASAISSLKLSFDFEQKYSYQDINSWFFVTLNDSIYLKDINGDSVWHRTDENTNLLFNLSNYVGGNIKLDFQGYFLHNFDNGEQPDYARIDNVKLWVPQQNDIGVINVTSSIQNDCGGVEDSIYVVVQNFGSNTVTNFTVSLVGNFGPYSLNWSNNFTGSLAPDSVTNVYVGVLNTTDTAHINLITYTTLLVDPDKSNDTVHFYDYNDVYKLLPYVETFSGYFNWNFSNFSISDYYDGGQYNNMLAYEFYGGNTNTNNQSTINRNSFAFTNSLYGKIKSNTLMTFDYQLSTEQSFNDTIGFFLVPDCGAPVDVYSINASNYIADNNWHNITVPIGNYAGSRITFGVYSAEATTNSYYIGIDNFGIFTPFEFDLGPDTAICGVDSIVFNTGLSLDSGYHFVWHGYGVSANDTLAFYTASAQGTYWVEVSDKSGLTVIDSVNLIVYPQIQAQLVTNKSLLCAGDSAQITMQLNGIFPMVMNWSDGVYIYVDTLMASSSRYLSPSISTQYFINSVTDSVGCSILNPANISITVIPKQNIEITGLDTQYCAEDANATLSATPLGGSFIGAGINGFNFSPKMAGAGNHDVIYEILDTNNCVSRDTVIITVFANPLVNIVSSIDSQYCSNDMPVNLYAYPAGGSYSGSGISASVFNPANANMGLDTIIYSITDANNCFNADTIITKVNSAPIVTINTVLDSAYCKDANQINISATPSGGIFSGMGISDTIFNPSQAGLGSKMILYSYTDVNGCSNYDTAYTVINQIPTVLITTSLNANYCENSPSVNLSAYPSGGSFTGNGITGNSFSPSTAGTGTHQIVYSFTDINGCSNSDTVTTTVNSAPVVTITSTINTSYCQDEASFTLAASPTGGSFNGMGVTGNTFNPSQAGLGSKMILYSYTDSNGCSSYDTSYTIVNPLPTVLITTSLNANYCENSPSVNLSAYPSGGSFTGNGITGNSFSPSTAGTGTHQIVYSFTDINGCSNSDTVETVINPLPTVSLGSFAVCANQGSVNLVGGTPSGGVYTGNAVNSTQSVFYPNNAPVGLNEITYKYTDSYGCENQATNMVRVIGVPLASFTTPANLCKSDTAIVNFTANVGANATYTWGFDNANIISGTNAGPYELMWNTSGIKALNVTVTDSGCVSNIAANYTNVIDAIATATLIGNDSACFGDNLLMFANGGNGYSYQWYDTSNTLTSVNDTLSYFTTSQTGHYFVKVTNEIGCSAISNNVDIYVNPQITSDFILPAIACKDDMVSVNYSGNSSTSAQFVWDFDNGQIASGSAGGPYNIIWNTDSIKNVTLDVMDNGCFAGITSHSINILTTPAHITALGSTSFCAGGNVTLSANSGNYSYQWYKDGIAYASTPIITTGLAGTYKVEITNNSTNCSNISDSVVVVVNTTDFNIAFTATPTSFTIPPFNTTFNNQTPNVNDYYWMWSFGDGNSSTFVNPTHQYMFDGTYNVGVIAQNIATGCFDTLVKANYITCDGGTSNPCNLDATIMNIGGNHVCAGDSVRLFAKDHTPGISYQWLRDGILLGGKTDSVYYAKQTGLYQLLLNDATCSVFSQPFSLTQYSTTTPSILTNGVIIPCTDDSMELYVSTSFNSYQWSNGSVSPSIFVKNSGSFIVTVTDNNGCHAASQPYVVNASLLQAPEICIVGIDTATNHNRVVWERTANSLIDSFKVYRESTVAGVYNLIGSQPFSDLSVFEDVNSNPAQQAYRYRITAIDTCGMETPPSSIHKTLHLTINAGLGGVWNLIWTGYKGFNFGSYRIYRGTDSTQMTLLTQIQSTLTSYTDLNPPTGDVYYQIEVMSPHPCYPDSIYTKANTNYNASRSNTANTNMAPNTGFVQSVSKQLSMQIYPNPNKGLFTLEVVANSPKITSYVLEVYNTLGSIIYHENVDAGGNLQKQMHFETLSKGVYFIRLRSKNDVLTTRFIVE